MTTNHDMDIYNTLVTDITETLGEAGEKLNEMRNNKEENSNDYKIRKHIHKLLSDADKSLTRLKEESNNDEICFEDKQSIQKSLKKLNRVLQEYRTEFQDLKDGSFKKVESHEPVILVTETTKSVHKNDDNEKQLQTYQTGMNDKLDEAVTLSNNTLDILNETRKTNEITIEIAQATLIRMAKQRDKMAKIQERLDEIGTNTKRAKKEISAFLRGVACDKCIIIIIVIVILLGVGFIVGKIVCNSCFTVDFTKNLLNQNKPTPVNSST